MAEALFNSLAQGRYNAASAGTKPSLRLNPKVARAMSEMGIEIGQQKPKQLIPEMLIAARRVITMGCGVQDSCPALSMPTEDWKLDDPQGKSISEIRQIRNQIIVKVIDLIRDLDRNLTKP